MLVLDINLNNDSLNYMYFFRIDYGFLYTYNFLQVVDLDLQF